MADMLPPPTPAAPSPPRQLSLTPEEVRQWWARIELDRARRKRESERWKRYLRNYLPAPNATPDEINSNIHFRNVHTKIAEVWAQFPQLQITAAAPLPSVPNLQTGQPITQDEAIELKRVALNKYLGRTHAHVDLAIEEALFDIFATSGIGPTKICYEADIKYVEQLMPGPATPAPGSVLGLQDVPGPMVKTEVPVVVNERLRWYRFSPAKLGIPHDWTSTDYDAAPYLWMEFTERNTPMARKRYHLPEDFSGTASRDEKVLSEHVPNVGGTMDLIQGVEIWLHANQFDPQEANSDVFYRLVLIEGRKETAALYELSPYQTIAPDGSLTDDSMRGNTIHPIVLRVASDVSWIPSDAAFTNPLVALENQWMAQDVALRDSNIPRFVHSDSITVAVDKLKEAGSGQGVGIPEAEMMKGIARLVAPLPHLERAQSDVAGREQIKQAQRETLGLSPNQTGNYNDHGVSATESAIVESKSSRRLTKEQNKLITRILQGIEMKFAPLMQRYMDQQDYAQIMGADGAMTFVAYTNAQLAGKFAYDILPDSQLTQDQSSRIKRAVDYVNFTAKSPFSNQGAALRLVTQEFGYDPSKLIKQPEPPPPPMPSVSLALKGADLGIPEVQIVLKQLGIQLPAVPSPEMQMAMLAQSQQGAQAQVHGGTADKAELLDKHQSEETGQQVGSPPLAGAQIAPVPGMVQ